jgi:hypothetical protein
VSIDTSVPHQISDSGHYRLKRRFLDGLAEFAAKEHGPLFVACVAMRESEGEVRIWITRNKGFEPSDHEFFERFSGLLSSWFYQEIKPSRVTLFETFARLCSGIFSSQQVCVHHLFTGCALS